MFHQLNYDTSVMSKSCCCCCCFAVAVAAATAALVEAPIHVAIGTILRR